MCLLHSNELPLRKLFLSLDGTTTGPNTFSGPLGKLFVKKGYLNSLPIVKFKAVPVPPLPPLDRSLLSKDQQHLYDLFECVRTGRISDEIASRIIGPVHHARFLTLAISILRLYMSSMTPSSALSQLVHYVLKVYAPVFFSVKCLPKIYDGAKHLFLMFQGLKKLSRPQYDLLFPVVLNNSYFWHSENLLLAMLVDEDINIRRDAVQKIVRARQEATQNDSVRVFTKIDRNIVNENAQEYHEVLHWHRIQRKFLVQFKTYFQSAALCIFFYTF